MFITLKENLRLKALALRKHEVHFKKFRTHVDLDKCGEKLFFSPDK